MYRRSHPDLNLLHFLALLLGFLLFQFLLLLIAKLIIVHYSSYWRFGAGRYFYQVQPFRLGDFKSFFTFQNPDIFAIFINNAQFRSGYLVVYP